MRFVFVHGWGYDAAFWQPLISALQPRDYTLVDFGYLGANPVLPDDEDAIYITHSMGTMWALSERVTSMRGLTALNGFSYFGDFFDARVLVRMQKRLQRGAQAQMYDFWQGCGFAPDYEALDAHRLDEGLSWLSSWDAREALTAFDKPLLVLGGLEDQICAPKAMAAHWAGRDVAFIEGADHAMAVHRADMCAAHIKVFLDGI